MIDVAALHNAHPSWAWIALAAVLLAVEAVTGSGWLLWPAACAGLVALLSGLTGMPATAAVLVFAVLTIATTFLARRYLPRPLRPHGRDINDNIGRLVGHRGQAVRDFQSGQGRVFIDGKEWPAELAEGEAPRAGATVEVVGFEGTQLRVRNA